MQRSNIFRSLGLDGRVKTWKSMPVDEAIQELNRIRNDIEAGITILNEDRVVVSRIREYVDTSQSKVTGRRMTRRGREAPHVESESTYVLAETAVRRTPWESILVNEFVSWLLDEKGVSATLEKHFIDVSFELDGKSYCVEAKHISSSTTGPIRTAIGQLLEYNMYPGRTPADVWIVLTDLEPDEKERLWLSSMREAFGAEKFPVYLAWKDESLFAFNAL